MLKHLQQAVAHELKAGKFVITLGGEHSISTAPILAHAAYKVSEDVGAFISIRIPICVRSMAEHLTAMQAFMARVAEAGFPMDPCSPGWNSCAVYRRVAFRKAE